MEQLQESSNEKGVEKEITFNKEMTVLINNDLEEIYEFNVKNGYQHYK